MNNLKVKIKDIRDKLKISQKDFANELNISRSGIAQIEAGKTNPSFELIEKIVKIYGVSPDYFFNDSEFDANEIRGQNNVQVNVPVNVQDNNIIDPFILEDLKTLKIISRFNIDDIMPYLSNSDTRNRAILLNFKQELKEKLNTYNAIFEIANALKIIQKDDNKYELVNVKDYINDIVSDYNPAEYKEGLKFESKKVEIIIHILAMKDSIEHIIFLTDNRIQYLKQDCLWFVEQGFITNS